MILKTSSNRNSNLKQFKNMFIQTLNRYKFISILYMISLLIYPVFVFLGRKLKPLNIYEVILSLEKIHVSIAALIFSCLIFSFMHKKNSTDLFYSLPIKKEILLSSRYFSGILLTIVPVVVNTFIMLFMSLSTKENEVIINNFYLLLLEIFIMFSLCSFISVCNGRLINTIFSVALIIIFLPILHIMANSNISNMVPGFICYSSNVFDFKFLTIFPIVLFIAMIIVGKKRKSEVAETNFVWKWLKYTVKIMTDITSGLTVGSIIFYYTDQIALFWIGIVLGSLIADFIVDSIYSKSLKKFNLLSYLMSLGITVSFYLIASFGLFNADIYVPNTKAVKSVNFETIGMYQNSSQYTTYDSEDYGTVVKSEIDDKVTIGKICSLHSEIIKNIREDNSYPYQIKKLKFYNSKLITINYKLNNGQIIERCYYVDKNSYQDYINDVIDSEGYKKKSSIVFNMDSIDLYDFLVNEQLILTNTQKEILLKAMKADFLEDKVSKLNSVPDNENIYLKIGRLSERQFFCDSETWKIPPYYERTRAVLKEFNAI